VCVRPNGDHRGCRPSPAVAVGPAVPRSARLHRWSALTGAKQRRFRTCRELVKRRWVWNQEKGNVQKQRPPPPCPHTLWHPSRAAGTLKQVVRPPTTKKSKWFLKCICLFLKWGGGEWKAPHHPGVRRVWETNAGMLLTVCPPTSSGGHVVLLSPRRPSAPSASARGWSTTRSTRFTHTHTSPTLINTNRAHDGALNNTCRWPLPKTEHVLNGFQTLFRQRATPS